MTKLFVYRFNARNGPARVSVGVSEEGLTLIYFPNCLEPARVIAGRPIEINVSVLGGPLGEFVTTIEAEQCTWRTRYGEQTFMQRFMQQWKPSWISWALGFGTGSCLMFTWMFLWYAIKW